MNLVAKLGIDGIAAAWHVLGGRGVGVLRTASSSNAVGGRLLVFGLDGQRYALALAVVERIVRAVELTPLPNAPSTVLGVIDLGGTVLPVLSLRRRLGLPAREICPEDHLVVARTTGRLVALVVDEAHGVIEQPETASVPSAEIILGLEDLKGVARRDDGLIVIYDLDRFLSLDDADNLDRAMSHEFTHPD